MLTRRECFVLTAAGVSLCCLPLAHAGAEGIERTWKVDGVERSALVYVPAVIPKTGSPVVFAFHGHGGNMRYADRAYHFQSLWPEAVIVYMQGLPTVGALVDPAGLKNGWQSRIGDQNDRDLKFFDAVLSTLQNEKKIDPKRVYITGHSNGGGFSYLLWAAREKKITAIAPVAAIAGRDLIGAHPKPVLHIAGQNDPLVRYAWQTRTVEAVKKIDSCSTAGKPWGNQGSLTGTEYKSQTGTAVVFVTHPGTHTYPPDAPELIVKFFKEVNAQVAIDAKNQDASQPGGNTIPAGR